MIQHDKDGVAQQEPTLAGEFHQPLQHFTATVAFDDLGSGATDAIAIAGFPTNVIVHGSTVEILTAYVDANTDVTLTVGDTGDADELIGSIALHGVAAGWIATAPTGFFPRFEPDYSTAGLDFNFAGTELDDVTAGELQITILYSTPKLSTD